MANHAGVNVKKAFFLLSCEAAVSVTRWGEILLFGYFLLEHFLHFK
jgi:hypothetical protein